MDRMKELVLQLNKASDAYYNGREIMSNLEFDALFDELKQLEQESGKVLYDSPTVKVGFAPVDSLPKFRHKFPALSLDKTKDINEFTSKFKKGIEDSGDSNDNVVLMWKEDGSTVQAYYNEGRLQNLVTRGNGEIGSDITHNAPAIYGIPLRIGFKGELVVRGEALISYDDFNAINEKFPDEEKFKNPRNLASASIQMLDPNEVTKRHVVVKAFNLVYIDYIGEGSPFEEDDKLHDLSVSWREFRRTFSGRLQILHVLGFNDVENIVCKVSELPESIKKMTDQVKDYIYPVDGLVAAMDNYDYAHDLEGTEHHPNVMQGYAFKWADEAVETVVREIEWSPSRTGLLNPVAIFDPVDLYGTTVTRASIHNVSIVRDLNIRVGDRISVTKANMVIPFIVDNLDRDNHPEYTSESLNELVGYCPTCKTKVVINTSKEGIMTAYCPNEDCPEKMIGKLAHFCSRDCMDIQGMSEETIKKLVDAGFIKEYADFFKLDQKPGISFLPGFGKQSWRKMCEAADKAKNTDFIKFVTSLSIPNIGKGQAKLLYKYLSTNFDDLCKWCSIDTEPYRPMILLAELADQDYDFTKIDGFGNIMADTLVSWMKKHFSYNYNTPEEEVYSLLTFTDERPKEVSESSISGKSFCITGKLVTFKNRKDLVSKIEELGGKWVDSVSSKTDYLINNDVTSTSGKNKKAKDLNIPIISEQDFLDMVGG